MTPYSLEDEYHYFLCIPMAIINYYPTDAIESIDETGFTCRTVFIVIPYSAANDGLPSNNWFVSKVT
jgi:hypothetical protein